MPELRRDLLNPTLEKILNIFKLDKFYVRGRGCRLTDETGESCLDFISQYGAVPFGYNPAFVWEALDRVKEAGIPSLVQPSLPIEALRLANRLAEIAPGDLTYCTFCQSGAEAVEAGIKLARSTTGRDLIIATDNSFHGKTLGALSATGKKSYQRPFCAPAPGFIHIPYNDPEALEAAVKLYPDRVAAFIVEPIQGEGGIIPAAPGYLKKAREVCERSGIIFILDEIQTGLGRTGWLFACEHDEVRPDILLLSKALGGGMVPLGVCISSARIWNEDFGHLHSSTFANNNLACAVGNAVVDRLLEADQAIIKQVREKGDYILQHLHELAERFPAVVKEVRGRGLMIGMEFHSLANCASFDLAYISESGGFTALICGFLLNVYKIRLAPFLNDSMTLRLEPSLTIEYEEIDYVLNALEDLCLILDYRDYGLLYRYLIGDSSRPAKVRDYRPLYRPSKHSVCINSEVIDKRFAFIIHYPGPEDMVAGNPSFECFKRDELFSLMEWQARIPDPAVCCHMPAIRSKAGSLVEGWLIGVPFGGKEMMSRPRQEVVDSIARAVDLARDLGADVVGLGALTSAVTRGGRDVLERGIAVTSGNSLTTVMALEALYEGARGMKIDLQKSRAAVVGAAGSIGRACTRLLVEEVEQITLLGSPRARVSSQRRLRALGEELLYESNRRRKLGHGRGLSAWLDRITEMLRCADTESGPDLLGKLHQNEKISWDEYEQICLVLGLQPPLTIAVDVEEVLNSCDLIITASNSPDYIVYPHHLKPGAVVCDVAKPSDVAPEVLIERDDVLVLEGGLVELPDQVNFGANFGFRDGVAFACLSETIMLAMEGDRRDHSIGSKLPLESMEYMRELAKRHGFKLAALKMGGREIDDDEINAVYHSSLNKKFSRRIIEAAPSIKTQSNL